jgi:DNA-binding MarR family transcriptional regulator
MPQHLGHQVRLLHWRLEQTMNDALAQMDLTASQGHIMGFLCRQSTPPCARDIEQFFRLSHPTVSGILTRLEKKGFIEFFPDELDRRCKRIRVLPKGVECHQRIKDAIHRSEEQMLTGFTEAEKEQFFSYFHRIIQNTGGCACKHKPDLKEESQT